MSRSLPRRGYADSRWGQLHYVEQGEGPAVLLLHQTPRSWDEFRELIPLLAASNRVVAVDMLGFGGSASEGPKQSIEGMAEAGWAVLDHLGIERAAVMGHHTGGLVANEMAAMLPDRPTGLVLSSSSFVDAAYRERHADGHGVDEATSVENGSHLIELWDMRRPLYPTPAASLLDRFIHDATTYGIDPAEGHRACVRYLGEERAPLIIAPTLLLVAGKDPFSVPEAEPLAASLVAAESVTIHLIPEGTVAMMEHQAHEVATVVAPFLSTVAR